MSVPEPRGRSGPARPPAAGRLPAVLLALLGIVLTLPGICSAVFVVAFVGAAERTPARSSGSGCSASCSRRRESR